MTTAVMAEKGRMVVARFVDGRVIKGTVQDFAPNRPVFHIYEGGDEQQKALAVNAEDLKALFFVKTYQGNRQHLADNTFDRARGQGRKIRVRFLDGEELAGFTMGYNPGKPGFFVIPADPDSNNVRVYVLSSAVDKVEWA